MRATYLQFLMRGWSKLLFSFGLLALLVSAGCQGGWGDGANGTAVPSDTLSWEETRRSARGKTVDMMMWRGDPQINRYMEGYVKPALEERYGITLQLLPGQGRRITSLMMNEKRAKKERSEVDMVWINGETFYQLRRLNALYGPFLQHLPHAELLRLEDPFVGQDFQQPIEGMEAPWGNVQLTVIYDKARTAAPPQNLRELGQYVKKHPGKFTIPGEFTGMTLLKSWLIAIAGEEELYGEFQEDRYERYRDSLFSWIEAHRKYFWREGSDFPQTVSQLHQLFANAQVDFTFSNNDSEVENKVRQGEFPPTARAYVYETGSIRNSHYLGIVRWSENPNAAMTVINFLLSPEAQLRKMRPEVWGDGTVLNREKLDTTWQQKFKGIAERRYVPSRDSLRKDALQELAPEYMVRLYSDFRQEIVAGAE